MTLPAFLISWGALVLVGVSAYLYGFRVAGRQVERMASTVSDHERRLLAIEPVLTDHGLRLVVGESAVGELGKRQALVAVAVSDLDRRMVVGAL